MTGRTPSTRSVDYCVMMIVAIMGMSGVRIMSQGVLAFKYEAETKATGMTALEGLPMYLE